MNKKSILMICIVISCFISGCGDDSDYSNDIQGVWVSNCHELVHAVDGTFIAYEIDTYDFESNNYTLESVAYEEDTCITPNGNVDNYFGNYTIGENVISSNGDMVSRISLIQDSPDWPDHIEPAEFEWIYRISGVELNFGPYESGEIPEIVYDITYTKQNGL